MRTIISATIFTVAVVSLTRATVSREEKELISKSREICIEETGIDKEFLKHAKEMGFLDEPIFKEFVYCMTKKVGFQNDDGEIQKDVIIEKLGSAIHDIDKAKEATEKCISGSGIDGAYNIAKCFYEKYPDYYAQFS